MPTLKQAQHDSKAMEQFIADHEPLEAPKEPLQRYIDASANPLESSKAGRSKSQMGSGGDCK